VAGIGGVAVRRANINSYLSAARLATLSRRIPPVGALPGWGGIALRRKRSLSFPN